MIPLQMELGGKDVCIVCEDADLDLAIKHIIKGIQICDHGSLTVARMRVRWFLL